jgi:hypothetical protein
VEVALVSGEIESYIYRADLFFKVKIFLNFFCTAQTTTKMSWQPVPQTTTGCAIELAARLVNGGPELPDDRWIEDRVTCVLLDWFTEGGFTSDRLIEALSNHKPTGARFGPTKAQRVCDVAEKVASTHWQTYAETVQDGGEEQAAGEDAHYNDGSWDSDQDSVFSVEEEEEAGVETGIGSGADRQRSAKDQEDAAQEAAFLDHLVRNPRRQTRRMDENYALNACGINAEGADMDGFSGTIEAENEEGFLALQNWLGVDRIRPAGVEGPRNPWNKGFYNPDREALLTWGDHVGVTVGMNRNGYSKRDVGKADGDGGEIITAAMVMSGLDEVRYRTTMPGDHNTGRPTLVPTKNYHRLYEPHPPVGPGSIFLDAIKAAGLPVGLFTYGTKVSPGRSRAFAVASEHAAMRHMDIAVSRPLGQRLTCYQAGDSGSSSRLKVDIFDVRDIKGMGNYRWRASAKERQAVVRKYGLELPVGVTYFELAYACYHGEEVQTTTPRRPLLQDVLLLLLTFCRKINRYLNPTHISRYNFKTKYEGGSDMPSSAKEVRAVLKEGKKTIEYWEGDLARWNETSAFRERIEATATGEALDPERFMSRDWRRTVSASEGSILGPRAKAIADFNSMLVALIMEHSEKLFCIERHPMYLDTSQMQTFLEYPRNALEEAHSAFSKVERQLPNCRDINWKLLSHLTALEQAKLAVKLCDLRMSLLYIPNEDLGARATLAQLEKAGDLEAWRKAIREREKRYLRIEEIDGIVKGWTKEELVNFYVDVMIKKKKEVLPNLLRLLGVRVPSKNRVPANVELLKRKLCEDFEYGRQVFNWLATTLGWDGGRRSDGTGGAGGVDYAAEAMDEDGRSAAERTEDDEVADATNTDGGEGDAADASLHEDMEEFAREQASNSRSIYDIMEEFAREQVSSTRSIYDVMEEFAREQASNSRSI